MGCFAGWCQLYVTAYGDVTPCDFTPLRFGNCRTEPVADIWKRLASHEAYCERSRHCRMQDHEFRAKYIDHIPDAGPFPYPVELADAESRTVGVAQNRPKGSSIGIKR